MRTIIFFGLLSLAIGGLIGAQKSDEPQGRQKDGQLAQLQKQLEKFQSDLQNLKSGGASRTGAVKESTAQEIVGEEMNRISMPQRRGVGWQPLKRSGGEEQSFQLGFNDPSNLRQQMVDVIEDHLLRDLESARQYGVEPQQILQDLRAKHQRDQD